MTIEATDVEVMDRNQAANERAARATAPTPESLARSEVLLDRLARWLADVAGNRPR